MVCSMFTTYYEQLVHTAQKYSVNLRDACRAAGVADTTLARWEGNQFSPSETTARKIYTQILAIVETRIDSAA